MQKHRQLLTKRTVPFVVTFGVVFAIAGVVAIFSSNAATFTMSVEAESGTVTGSAISVSNTAASNGQAVKFDLTPSTGGSLLKPSNTFRKVSNLKFGNKSSRLLLDLYLPDSSGPYPLVVWIHGGGWAAGSKEPGDCFAYQKQLMQKGFAVACIQYRLSNEAIFPAQIEDVKSAIRYLRANAATYKLYPDKIGVWGNSAGGHLAALAGTAGGQAQFDKGSNLGQSSSVQAVVDFHGPSDFIAFVQTPGYTSHGAAGSAEAALIGGPVLQNQAKAQLASPIHYITADDPPFLIFHGTADGTVPINQSQLLQDALTQAGLTSKFTAIQGAGHDNNAMATPANMTAIVNFFDSILRP